MPHRLKQPHFRTALSCVALGVLGSTTDARIVAPAVFADFASSEPTASAPAERPWLLHEGRHWQLASNDFEDPVETDGKEGTSGVCPVGMVAVQGLRKLDPAPYFIETLQKLTCSRWIAKDFPERCGEFDRAGWLAISAKIASVPIAFCIDRFEYPNIKGQYPWVFVTWNEAADLCARQAKRLCSEDEWTFACEGEEATPYPYGYKRSAEACVIDRPGLEYRESEFADRKSDTSRTALNRIFQGEPSGSHRTCRSVFGVYDLTGNVDEWTFSRSPTGYRSILKGGYWGPVRVRCRPSTRIHGEDFAYYQQGFRCCAHLPSP